MEKVAYKYNYGKTLAKTDSYLIKGIRGAVRHRVMAVCKERGINVCHTSDKIEDKHGKKFIQYGFHPAGSCIDTKECLVHKIFGSLRHKGKITVFCKPVVTFPKERSAAVPVEDVQVVRVATENRIVQGYDGRSIQDFQERYISGRIIFEIKVSQCRPEEVGLLFHALIGLKRVGGGYNSGYGHVNVEKIAYVERTIVKTPKYSKKEKAFVMETATKEKSLEQELRRSMTAWIEGYE